MKTPTMRLDRLLANLGYGSRREVAQMVAAGLVTGNAGRLRDAGERLAITPDLPHWLTIHGAPVGPPPPLTLIFHKPVGVVCSHKEPGRSVYELLPPRWRRRDPVLSTIGRLDLETSGLLLITDDGGLLHRVISPRNHVTKRYLAILDRPLSGGEAAVFAAGDLVLEGETDPLAPAVLEPLSPTSAWLTVTEGRYHQVRRMFAAVGNHVVALHRDRIGGLDLPEDIDAGAYRIATPEELAAVFAGA